MPLRTADDYRAALDDGRSLYYQGAAVANINEVADLRVAAEITIAIGLHPTASISLDDVERISLNPFDDRAVRNEGICSCPDSLRNCINTLSISS